MIVGHFSVECHVILTARLEEAMFGAG